MRRCGIYHAGLLPLLVAVLLAGCGTAGSGTPRPDGPAQDVTPILATTALRVGEQRVAFLLETPSELVTLPEVHVSASYVGDGEAGGDDDTAAFHEWPFGTRGTYVTRLDFERSGPWRLDIAAGEGHVRTETTLTVEVRESIPVPDVGEVPPFTNNATLASAEVSHLTSGSAPDPDLYAMTVAEALITGRPTVVVFASPAFCTTPTCGPQVETVVELKDRYGEQANFIHLEVYDRPDLVQGDPDAAAYRQAVIDWGLTDVPEYRNESWVFVLGRDGRVAAHFEAYATLSEIEAALTDVL